jgi:hypothetical protein
VGLEVLGFRWMSGDVRRSGAGSQSEIVGGGGRGVTEAGRVRGGASGWNHGEVWTPSLHPYRVVKTSLYCFLFS